MPSGIRNARQHIEALRTALVSPLLEEIERCLPGLEEAARSLTTAEAELRASGTHRPTIAHELKALSHEVKLASRLIEHGAAFHSGWAKLLGAAAAGYMPTGEAAPITGLVQATGRISVRG
jgi:hypothetical protein